MNEKRLSSVAVGCVVRFPGAGPGDDVGVVFARSPEDRASGSTEVAFRRYSRIFVWDYAGGDPEVEVLGRGDWSEREITFDAQKTAGVLQHEKYKGRHVWTQYSCGRYSCGVWYYRTPEQLLVECLTTIADLEKNHPGLMSRTVLGQSPKPELPPVPCG